MKNKYSIVSKIAVALLAATFTLSSSAAAKQYKIKGDKINGSKMRYVDASSPIPFDKKYGELSDEQRKIFRDGYGVLADTEKPPFPTKGTQAIYKPIIKGHYDIARAGNLFLVAMVNEKGKVENVSVYESPADSMTQYATAVLFNTEFEPATCDGTPCKMEYPFEFSLRTIEKNIKTDGGLKRNRR